MSSSPPVHVRKDTVAEREAIGVKARQRRARPAIGSYEPAAQRPDPVALLAGQETHRVASLLPIRHARMAVSPFTFYRGSAVIMASDLGAMPDSGLVTQLCGDAHLANFGLFAAPDRSLVFDINDFDETHPGPFEWDVQRLATSIVLSGREVGLSESSIRLAAEAVGQSYRAQMATYAGMSDLAVWYDRIDVDEMKQWARSEGFNQATKRIDKSAAKARTRDSWSAVAKMTQVVDGHRQFLDQPPLLVPVQRDGEAGARLSVLLDRYRGTLLFDRAVLMDRYHEVDLALKVVGVGSVGLMAFVLLLEGRDPDDLLVLQAKEAVPSVLEPFAGASAFANMGERVVQGQRVMQAASDVFLGWIRTDSGHDFYLRQLRDMKFAPDPVGFTEKSLRGYGMLCARALARAHARSGDAVAITAYLGASTKFDVAIRDFALAYTEQVNADFAAYTAAIGAGRVSVADESKPAVYSVVAKPGSAVEVVSEPASSAGSADSAGSAGPASS